MIDLVREEVISLAEATTRLPKRKGKTIHPSTMNRWATKGVNGVKLETICVGVTRCTSMEKLKEFCRALTEGGERIEP